MSLQYPSPFPLSSFRVWIIFTMAIFLFSILSLYIFILCRKALLIFPNNNFLKLFLGSPSRIFFLVSQFTFLFLLFSYPLPSFFFLSSSLFNPSCLLLILLIFLSFSSYLLLFLILPIYFLFFLSSFLILPIFFSSQCFLFTSYSSYLASFFFLFSSLFNPSYLILILLIFLPFSSYLLSYLTYFTRIL